MKGRRQALTVGIPTVRGHGAPDQIRTDDTRFRRAVLYPLSYRGDSGPLYTGCGQRASRAPPRGRAPAWDQPRIVPCAIERRAIEL